jgi:hypothetical protein
VFVFDRQSATIRRVSVDSNGAQANGNSLTPSMSPDARYVAFESLASNLVLGDNNNAQDVFVATLANGSMQRVSVNSASIQANGTSGDAAITADGRYVAFASDASNLVFGDTNGAADIFLRDREIGTSFQSLCDPGVGGVSSCPCSNPPSGPGRGCNNSSATGGAILSASGGTSLAFDDLVFTTSGEKPSALSIVLQGDLLIAPGAVYGQGVRCVGGAPQAPLHEVGRRRQHHRAAARRGRPERVRALGRRRAIRSSRGRAAGTSSTIAIRPCSAAAPPRARSTRRRPGK